MEIVSLSEFIDRYFPGCKFLLPVGFKVESFPRIQILLPEKLPDNPVRLAAERAVDAAWEKNRWL